MMANIQIDEQSVAIKIKKGRYEKLLLNDIYYIDVYRHEIYIHLQQSTILVRSTMDTLAGCLMDQGFVRIHRSYLVNIHHVDRIDRNDIVLKNGAVLPVSRYKKQVVRQCCNA